MVSLKGINTVNSHRLRDRIGVTFEARFCFKESNEHRYTTQWANVVVEVESFVRMEEVACIRDSAFIKV